MLVNIMTRASRYHSCFAQYGRRLRPPREHCACEESFVGCVWTHPTCPGNIKMSSNNSTKARRQVALAYPLAVPWMTLYVRGIMDYARQHGGWSLTTSPPSLIGAGEEPLTLDSLRGWSGHGVITAILTRKDIRSARRLGIPVVNLAATLRDTEIPRVMPDHYGMGCLAAEHLLQRGLRRLAYFGLEGFWFSKERCRGFVERAEQEGRDMRRPGSAAEFGPRGQLAKTNQLVGRLAATTPSAGRAVGGSRLSGPRGDRRMRTFGAAHSS